MYLYIQVYLCILIQVYQYKLPSLSVVCSLARWICRLIIMSIVAGLSRQFVCVDSYAYAQLRNPHNMYKT